MSAVILVGCAHHATPDATSTGAETRPTPETPPATETDPTPEPVQEVAAVGLDEAHQAFEAGEGRFVDVNSTDTREQLGFIPGALLLSSFEFDPSELEGFRETALIFYCVNPSCPVGRMAAEYAQSLGFTDVGYMPEGIFGWRDAGYEIAFPSNVEVAP